MSAYWIEYCEAKFDDLTLEVMFIFALFCCIIPTDAPLSDNSLGFGDTDVTLCTVFVSIYL